MTNSDGVVDGVPIDGVVQCDTAFVLTDSEITLEVRDAGNATGRDSVSLTLVPTLSRHSQTW